MTKKSKNNNINQGLEFLKKNKINEKEIEKYRIEEGFTANEKNRIEESNMNDLETIYNRNLSEYANQQKILADIINVSLKKNNSKDNGISNNTVTLNNGNGLTGYVTKSNVFKQWSSPEEMKKASLNPKCKIKKTNNSISTVYNDSDGLFTIMEPSDKNPDAFLLLGSPMKPGPNGNYGCGNEGVNVYVGSTSSGGEVTYKGCYKDSNKNHLTIQNDLGVTTFDECKQRAIDSGSGLFMIQADASNNSKDGYCMIGKNIDYDKAISGGIAQDYIPNIVNIPLLTIRLGGTDWARRIRNSDTSIANLQWWWPDGQFLSGSMAGNQIGAQFQYFAEYWLNRNNIGVGVTKSMIVVGGTSYYNRVIGTFKFYRDYTPNRYWGFFGPEGSNAGNASGAPWYFNPMSYFWTTSGQPGSGEYDGKKDYKPPQTIVRCNKGPSGKDIGNANIASALYEIDGINNTNIGKMASIDVNGILTPYPDNMISYSNNYTKVPNYFGNTTVIKSVNGDGTDNSCMNICNNTPNCAGFSKIQGNQVCKLHDKTMFPFGTRIFNAASNLFIRNKKVNNDSSCSKIIENIDSSEYDNYPQSGKNMTMTTKCNLGIITENQIKKIDNAETKFSNNINTLVNNVKTLSNEKSKLNNDLNNNYKNINNNVKEYDKIYDKITNIIKGNDIHDAMLNDTQLNLFVDNSKYITWSIITIIILIITIKLTRKA